MAALTQLAVAIAGLAGCYAPQFRDCTVTCASDADCVHGHVCGGDGLCAAPERAGHCAGIVVDAAPEDAHADAQIVDARPRPDAPPLDAAVLATLHVEKKGPGHVDVIGVGTCSDLDGAGGCDFMVPADVEVTLVAVGDGQHGAFDKWEDACAGQDATCQLAPPVGVTKAKARFRND